MALSFDNASPLLNDLMKKSIMLDSGPNTIRRLHTTRHNLDRDGKLRKWTFGRQNDNMQNKTILIMGETGTGKTTLINTMVNYYLGIKFEDQVWFEITEEEERGQPGSKTSEITVYEIFSEQKPFSLTIIDTPGYGDTQGTDKDVEFLHNLYKLFLHDAGVKGLNAVCLVLKASENRISESQHYVFEAVLSLFGKDIRWNVVLLITHSDRLIPDVLDVVEKDEISCCHNAENEPVHFLFNNLQRVIETGKNKRAVKLAWKMGESSTEGFFEFLKSRQRKSLTITTTVLHERMNLEVCLQCLKKQIELMEETEKDLAEVQKALKQRREKFQRNRFHFTVKMVYEEKDNFSTQLYYTMKDDYFTACRCHSTKDVEEARKHVKKEEKEKERVHINVKTELQDNEWELKDLEISLNNLLTKNENKKKSLIKDASERIMKQTSDSPFTIQYLNFLISRVEKAGDEEMATKLRVLQEQEKCKTKQIKAQRRNQVRVGHSLNKAEKKHVANREATVLRCLKQNGIDCSPDKLPKIAVLGSGGGLRAMVGLLGSLSQLKEEGLLDCITYLSGVSGSTWCMASLYKESDWSTNLQDVKENIKRRLAERSVTCSETFYKLWKYFEEKDPNDNFSLTDVWAALFVSVMVNEIDEHKLSEQRDKYTNDPYPIYNVIDKKCKHDELYADVWFEITPDESGYSLTGAFVDSASLESQFDKGQKTKDQAEIDMLFLQGLCGSAGADEEEIKKMTLKQLQNLSQTRWLQTDPENLDHEVMISLLQLNRCVLRGEDASGHLEDLAKLLEGKRDESGEEISLTLRSMKDTQAISQEQYTKIFWSIQFCIPCYSALDGPIFKRFKKILKDWIWGTTFNYVYNMEVPDIDPSILRSKKRHYIDAGLLNNSPYFSVLRKERDVDLIISFDFSDGDPLMTLVEAAKICKELHIPFPECDVSRNDITEPKDFYVFHSSNSSPTVIHIPLFNRVNCPGEVQKWREKYSTLLQHFNLSMSSALLEKAGLNVKNNKENLLKEIRHIMTKKNSSLE